MDLQLFIALNAMTISALIIAVSFIYRPRNQPDWVATNSSWLGVNAAILAIGAAALEFKPDIAGTVVGLIFLPLVAAPVFLFSQSQRASLGGKPKLAAILARGAALLHPTLANRVNAQLTAALATGDEDSNARALAELAKSAPEEYRPLVKAQLAMQKRDWGEVLAIAGDAGPAASALKPIEIRALGETGRTDAMVRCYMATRTGLASAHSLLSRLFVLAFGGRPKATAALLDRHFKGMDDATKTYWIAVGCLNSRDSAPGERALDDLARQSSNAKVRAAAQRQLEAFSASPLRPLSAETQTDLDIVERQVLQEAETPRRAVYWVPVTLTLIALNLAAFAAEVYYGGSQDSDTLISLGALWPPNVLDDGEWWRLLTATFLHFGPIHLFSNMLVLWVLGRLLEPIVGTTRMLLIYLIGGIGSSAFVLWLMTGAQTNYGMLVGASGAIFALLGAEAAIVLMSWWRDRETFDTRRLTTLAVILGLQMAIDLSVPNVSFAAHASGFVAGALILLALPMRGASRPSRPNSGAQA